MNTGYLFCILGALCFGFAPTALTLVLNSGIPNSSGPFFGALAMLIASTAICLIRRIPSRLPKKAVCRLLFVGAFGMGATTATLAASYQFIPAGTATVIHFLYPPVVTMVSILLFGQRPSKFTYPALISSVVGMAFISVLGSGSAGGALAGYALAFMSALTYSFYFIANERFGFDTIPTVVRLRYMTFASSSLMLVRAFITDGGITLPQSAPVWGYVLLYCMLMGGGYLFLTLGIVKVGAVNTSFATLLEPVTSVVCSTLLFKNPLTAYTVIGFALILLAVWMNSAHPPLKAEKAEI